MFKQWKSFVAPNSERLQNVFFKNMSVQKWSQTAARVHLCNWVLKLFVYLSGFLWCSQPAMPTKSLDPTFQSLHASNTRWVIIASCIFAVLKDPFINWKTTPRMGLSRTFVGWTHRIRMMPGWKSCDRGSRNSTKTNSFVLDLLFLCDHFFFVCFCWAAALGYGFLMAIFFNLEAVFVDLKIPRRTRSRLSEHDVRYVGLQIVQPLSFSSQTSGLGYTSTFTTVLLLHLGKRKT